MSLFDSVDILNITSIIGVDIFGSSDVIYVVPGVLPEIYINFGYFGAFLFFYMIGRFLVFVDVAYTSSLSGNAFGALFYGFVGSLVCLNLLNSSFYGFLNYLFFNGFPLIVGYFLYKKKYLIKV